MSESNQVKAIDNQLSKPLFIIVSLIQGILLTLLYRSNNSEIWPSTDPAWFVFLMTFSISFPILFLFSVTKSNIKAITIFLLSFTLLLSGLGAYVGFQKEPLAYIENNYVIVTFCITALIACFKMLMYVQQYASNEKISYSSLFKISWRNFIILAESGLFTLIFWGILELGAALFSVLNIHIFKDLLDQDWIIIPILSLAFGSSIFVFRNITF